ncbi:diaminopimelate decarboxylase [Candidatus Vidania fulgoroideorum]
MKLLKILKLLREVKNTPLFVYSINNILENIKYCNRTKFKIFYALKANYNKEIIKIIKIKGLGFEVVSIGELKKLAKEDIDRKNIIYSGVCKTNHDIRFIKSMNIGFINVDSITEIRRIKKIYSRGDKIPKLIIKLNLDINIDTNRNIKTCTSSNKFGIYRDEVKKLMQYIKKNNIKIAGIGFHLGSQIKDYKPYVLGVNMVINIVKKYKLEIRYINIGGGMAVDYRGKKNYLKIIIGKLKKKLKGIKKKIIIEPGRSLIASSCITLAKVILKKKSNIKRFAIVDIGMESIIRPMLYDCYHKIISCNISNSKKKIYDIVGPICESTDILGKNIKLGIRKDDNVIILDTGAYCISMRMNYNIRKKPIEILV